MKRDKKKEAIFQIGEKLFEKYGYKKVSVDEIVQRAGIAKGTFYLYYKSKDALYAEIVYSYEAIGKQCMITVMKEKDVRVRLLRAFLGRLKFISLKPILKEIFLENPLYFSPSVTLEKLFDINKEMTNNLIQENETYRKEVDDYFLGGIHWFFSSVIRYKGLHCQSEKEFWESAELLAKILIDGIFTESKWPEVHWNERWQALHSLLKK